jgi:signal transduction histidine kinase/DNA-binding NarL/FixJ family response regulator
MFTKFSIGENKVPSFTVREMIILSLLIMIEAFFFIQSFRSYENRFNDALDDVFKLSEIHNILEKKYLHENHLLTSQKFEDSNPQFKELIYYYNDLFEDVERLPNRDNQSFITYALDSNFIPSYDKEIDDILVNYKYVIQKNSYKEITNTSFEKPLSKVYELIRDKQKSYVYMTNNYRTATYLILFLIILYSSYIFISHYSKERSRAILSNNAKTDFLANMSHEIRTPLNGIIGMSELIQSTQLSEEQKKYSEALVSCATNLNELINDILDISKIESGHIEMEVVPFDLGDMLDNLISTFQINARNKKLKLYKEVSIDLQTAYLGDPTRIRQILTNLISNALKFTDVGHIKILVAPDVINPNDLYFEVEDTGIGIPENKRDAIFQKFSQADTSTTRKYGGTGLGLVITKNLVGLMGGHIDFKRNRFDGSTFWFSIPLPKTLKESIAHNASASKPDFKPITGKKILLVEDNPVNQEYALQILKTMGLSAVLAENGVAAVQYFRAHASEIDLILMDCRMPEMDGYEATQLIRNIELNQTPDKNIPIIALTANAIKGDIEKCMLSGMNDYLAKPISRRTLESALKNWLFSEPPPLQFILENPVVNNVKLIDMNIYAELLDLMGDEMQKITDQYIQSISTYIPIMASSLKNGEYNTIAESAHPLKSSSASMGAMQMSILCSQIENAARNEDPENILESLIQQTITISELTIQELRDSQNETT